MIGITQNCRHPLNRIRVLAIVSSLLVLVTVATTPLSADTITFTDNFTPSASPLWNDFAGTWTTSAGAYFAQIPNNDPLTFTGLPFDLTDFTVSVTVNSLGDGGLWLRSDGTNQNGVLLVTGGGGYGQGLRGGNAGQSLNWHVLQNGTCGGVPTTSCPGLGIVTGVFIPGDTYRVTVVVSGNQYSAFIDDSLIPATTLVDGTFSHGHVGLYDDQPNTITGSGFGPAQSFSNFSVQGSTVVPEPELLTTILLSGGLALLAGRGRRATLARFIRSVSNMNAPSTYPVDSAGR